MSLIVRGYDALLCGGILSPQIFHWSKKLFDSVTTDPKEFAARVQTQLGPLTLVNNIETAQLVASDPAGIDIRLGAITVSGWGTNWNLFEPLPLIKFGPIPIPKTINIDCYFQFWSGTHEVFGIFAKTNKKIYNLLTARQSTIDGNYSYGTNGITVNDTAQRVKTWAKTGSAQPYTGTFDVRNFNKCFTQGETDCEIFISRPSQTYHSGTSAGMKGRSKMVLKELEITW